MATSLHPPMGGRGIVTVEDDQVDRYLGQGWTRVDGKSAGLPDPEDTKVITDTGGGPDAGGDIDYVDTVVSRDLGDEDVLVTDFGTKVGTVKGGTGKVDTTDTTDTTAAERTGEGDTPEPKQTRKRS